MKRIINLVLICFICISISAQLPRKSVDLIKHHYPNCEINSYSVIDKLYWVSLSNNTILKFKKNGNLVEVIGYIPTLLIPYQINNHILWNYPHRPIHYYHKHNKGYDLHFKGGRHLKYNKRYKPRK